MLSANPMTELIEAVRNILIHAQWPDWIALGRVALISMLLFAAALLLIQRLTPRYVKLAS